MYPRADLIGRLAEALGVSPADLFGPKQQPRDFSGLAHEADNPADG